MLLCANARVPAQSINPSVYLLTIAPGSVYWEHFGHNALVVDPTGGDVLGEQAIAFNFGYFDMSEAGFMRNFIAGRMMYLGVRSVARREIEYYQSQNRAMWLQRLNLEPDQIANLQRYLVEQTTAPLDRYRYDYFRHNCSTRIRDTLNLALDGALEQQAKGRSSGQTFRSLGLAHAQPTLWLYAGIHAGLGPSTDQPLSFYQEYFIPAKLMLGLLDKQNRGSPLVASTQVIGAAVNALPELPYQPKWRYHFLVTGMLLALICALSLRRKSSRFASWPVALMSILFGAAGLMLWYLKLTDHHDAYHNLNALLWNPLWLAAWPGIFPRLPARWAHLILHSAWIISLASFAIKVLPAVKQQNIEWCLLSLPVLYVVWVWRTSAPQSKATPLDAALS